MIDLKDMGFMNFEKNSKALQDINYDKNRLYDAVQQLFNA